MRLVPICPSRSVMVFSSRGKKTSLEDWSTLLRESQRNDVLCQSFHVGRVSGSPIMEVTHTTHPVIPIKRSVTSKEYNVWMHNDGGWVVNVLPQAIDSSVSHIGFLTGMDDNNAVGCIRFDVLRYLDDM